MILDRATERLRSKHVRTLELLQQTLDENEDLRDRLAKAQQGTLHLGQGVPPAPSKPTDLENEIDRIKAEQCRKLVEVEESTRARLAELTAQVDTLLQAQNTQQNQATSLEMALRSVRDTLRQERVDTQAEKDELRRENLQLRQDMAVYLQKEAGIMAGASQRDEDLRALRDELDSVRQSRDQRQAQLDELDKELLDSEQALVRSQRELVEAKTRAAAMDIQLSSIQHEKQALDGQFAELQARETELRSQIAHLKGQNAPQRRPSSAAKLQLQQTSLLAKLQEMEARHTLLTDENNSLRSQLAALQTQLRAQDSEQQHPQHGSVFAVHVDLKRENFLLRAQVEELKQVQKRFLTSAKKKTLSFPAL